MMNLSLPILVDKYFGRYINKLKQADEEDIYSAYILNLLDDPSNLEARLQRIEDLNVTRGVIAEVGHLNQEPEEIDERLVDAWAELRTIDQLIRDGFSDLSKEKAIIDISARHGEQSYGVQVKHIRTKLAEHIDRLNTEAMRKGFPIRSGRLYNTTYRDIRYSYFLPLENLFWDALEDKNSKFSRLETTKMRLLAIVTNEPVLQDNVVRFLTCQAICLDIQALEPLHIDEVLWLLDDGHGALFKIDRNTKNVRCYVDWADNSLPDRGISKRREIDFCDSYEHFLP